MEYKNFFILEAAAIIKLYNEYVVQGMETYIRAIVKTKNMQPNIVRFYVV